MRVLGALTCLFLSAAATAERIVLIPLDSRPAAGQFSQLMGRIAGVHVLTPPAQYLGRYTNPGRPEALLSWLEKQNMSTVSAVVVSTDMLGYGGLIASRVSDVPYEQALERLRVLKEFKAKNPKIPIYAMSAVMRLYPTSTRASAAWRVQLGKYAEVKERYRTSRSQADFDRLVSLQSRVPPLEIARYEGARERNFRIQQALIRMTAQGTLDYIIFGQDDAQPVGPHIGETQRLKALATEMGVAGRSYFCEGVDQLSNILVSRAMLRKAGWTPRVRIIFADENGRRKIANYESKNVELSVRDQVVASGARPWVSGDYDYTLWLNTPDPESTAFQKFVATLVDEVDQGFPAGVADINLGKTGTGDARLFDRLWEQDRMIRLLSYAGWNTAGNTMGTSIPAANIYLLARRLGAFPLKRELAQREFVLHRFVNDYAYHKFTRPEAYKLIDSLPNASREETYGHDFDLVNQFVRDDMVRRLNEYFSAQFKGKRFFAGAQQYELAGIEGIAVKLPWPRAYEVQLDFRLTTKPVSSAD